MKGMQALKKFFVEFFESDRGQWMYWSPVLFSVGIILYSLLKPVSTLWVVSAVTVSLILFFIVVLYKPLEAFVQKYNLLHPTNFVRFLFFRLMRIGFYILLFPIFSQFFVLLLSIGVLTRIIRFFRFLIMTELAGPIWKGIVSFFRFIPLQWLRIPFLMPVWNFVKAKILAMIFQPFFWVRNIFSFLLIKLKHVRFWFLRRTVVMMHAYRMTFLKPLLFKRRRKKDIPLFFKSDFSWRPLLLIVAGILILSAGFARMHIRTECLDTELLHRKQYQKTITGTVENIEMKGYAYRVTLRDPHIQGIKDFPSDIRVTFKQVDFQIGDQVAFVGTLFAPSKATVVGEFDFAEYAYYEGLGATGYQVNKFPVRVIKGSPESFIDHVRLFRYQLAEKIRAIAPGEYGLFAATILTGQRYGLPESSLETFQEAGLSHLLSISGFHMVLLAFLVFFLFRYLLVLIRPLSQRMDMKKVASVLTFIVLVGYLLLSGARLPTQRAFIMVTCGMVALFMGRNPLSLRVLSLAAWIILLLTPEAIFNAGFQMSFGCTLALIVFYQKYRSYFMERPMTQSRVFKMWHRVRMYLFGVLATGVVAVASTAFFGAYHFHYLTFLNVLANLFAVPIFSVLIMPVAFIVVFEILLTGQSVFIHLLNLGYDWLWQIATSISAMPFASFSVSGIHPVGFGLFAFGGLLFLLMQQPLKRYLGIFFMLIGIGVGYFAYSLPRVLVNERQTLVAVKHYRTGRLIFLDKMSKDRYKADEWLELNGQKDVKYYESNVCPPKGEYCSYQNGSEQIVWFRNKEEFQKYTDRACHEADVIVTWYTHTIKKRCPSKLYQAK